MEAGLPAANCAGDILPSKDDNLAKPNYQYEKRQKDLARKKTPEETRQRKLKKPDGDTQPQETAAQPPGEGSTTPE
jgi:hypothetical protein